MEEAMVVIVGAGPAGLATSACLNRLSITNVVLERDDCYASLWKKRVYERLSLHIPKQYCGLPHMPYPSDAPTFIPKNGFISYLDNYVSHFKINPKYQRSVESAYYDENTGKWRVMAKNMALNVDEVYVGRFLVVASGTNSEAIIPEVPGLDSFRGEFMHSSKYVNGKKWKGKEVLVVGCGNSGMEIAYDLHNWGVKTSIVARSPVHVVSRPIVCLGLFLLNYFRISVVDSIIMLLTKLRFGDTSIHGIKMPKYGPFYLKRMTGRTPTIDVGTMDKIKAGEIKVLPSIRRINGDKVVFSNEEVKQFDAIIFATGYRSTVQKWLKDSTNLISENGVPKQSFPNRWKGKHGLYCAGLSNMGLDGLSNDAKNIASDIYLALSR
ncbi:FMO-like domain-containing protein [Cephalotus follicularis]|uniref:Flavin-containing monooxygenase n=1 Tax=Cephalotus follicularis TaxID=3775 RepID=A0A1Q3CGM2_CEPFO|nr:FMO-like domain-containing protein [Cephalotus follicularis]